MTTNYGPSSDFAPRPWLDSAPHYVSRGIDIRDVIEAFGLDFNLGSILKYVVRQKPGNTKLMDLRKAQVHLARAIAREEASNKEMYAPTPPPPPAVHIPTMHVPAGSYSNAGMDEARKQMQAQSHGFTFDQSVEPERLVPRQVCPADDVTRAYGEEGGTFISRPGASIPPTA